MRFQVSLLLSATLAMVVSAMPQFLESNHEGYSVMDMESEPVSEAGEILGSPTYFVPEEFDDYEQDVDLYFDDWKNQVINQHNAYRRHYGAGPVTWSDQLYSGTLQWAKQCQFHHSNGHYGENLAAGTGNAYGFTDGLKSWMDEASKYDYNHPGFSSGTGHFTQVVWKGSHQVACAIANCGANTIFKQPSKYVVCRYSPQGNIIGQFPQNVGRPQ